MDNKLIMGRYRLLKKIGTGGMSVVYKALDMKLNKIWAIKINEDNQLNKINIKSLMSEAEVLKNLNHPGMPVIVDISINKNDDRTIIYMVMEFIDGINLKQKVDKEGKLEESMVLEIALDICGVLKYLHKQTPPIIYRDMKPENIMIDKNRRIRLIDFGIARNYNMYSKTDTEKLGTVGFAAPEQFIKERQSDERTDIYSFGKTLQYILKGNINDINENKKAKKEINKDLEKIILKCINKNPDDRFQSVNQLENELIKYREKQKRMIYKCYFAIGIYRTFLMMTIVLIYIAIYSDYKGIKNKKEKEIELKNIADLSGNMQEKRNAIIEMIRENPNEKKRYEELLDTYIYDEKFEYDEERELIGVINEYALKHLTDEDLAYIYYRIGIYYWNYYELDEQGIAGKSKAAYVWFKKALENEISDEEKINARFYMIIGEFYRDIIANISHTEEVNEYRELVENMYLLIQMYKEDLVNIKKEDLLLMKNIISDNKEDMILTGVSREKIEIIVEELDRYYRGEDD